MVGTESGGGGPLTPAGLGNCWRGVHGVLAHLGVLGEPSLPVLPRNRTRYTRKWGHTAEVLSPGRGVRVPAG